MGYLPQPSGNRLKDKVSVVLADLTTLHVDAIVNPTNPNFLAGGPNTASHAILKAAGSGLVNDLSKRNPVDYGQAIVTPSYKLPCNYVIHVAVPHSSSGEEKLKECFRSCLSQFSGQYKESIAFPMIGTGVQGYSPERAANIALTIVREYLEKEALDPNSKVKKVVFCAYSVKDRDLYQALIPFHFTN